MTQVTYIAPAGDEAVVTTGGVRFFDGQSVDLGPEHGPLLAKLRNNPHFEVHGEPADLQEDPVDDDGVEIGLSARHKGRGKYAIVRATEGGEIVVRDGLTKADAAAFNALSVEDREAYVAD